MLEGDRVRPGECSRSERPSDAKHRGRVAEWSRLPVNSPLAPTLDAISGRQTGPTRVQEGGSARMSAPMGKSVRRTARSMPSRAKGRLAAETSRRSRSGLTAFCRLARRGMSHRIRNVGSQDRMIERFGAFALAGAPTRPRGESKANRTSSARARAVADRHDPTVAPLGPVRSRDPPPIAQGPAHALHP